MQMHIHAYVSTSFHIFVFLQKYESRLCLIFVWQVVALDDSFESRTIKLVLPLTESCIAMEIVSCFGDRAKHKQNALLLLSKSSQLYLYNDSQIEHYLLQCQSKSITSLPNHFMVKLPFTDSSITIARFYSGYCDSDILDEVALFIEHNYWCQCFYALWVFRLVADIAVFHLPIG